MSARAWANCARPCVRWSWSAILEGRYPAHLSAAGAVRRQHRGRSRRFPRLFRQRAAPAVAGPGGPAGRPAAVARDAPARPLPGSCEARPQPRAGSRRRSRRDLGRGSRPGRRWSPCRARAASSPCWRRTLPIRWSNKTRRGWSIASPSTPPPRGTSSSSRASIRQLLGGRLSAALIAVDHRSGEVIAHVGSPGYLDEDRFGAVDMTSAVRSPGSTLKPMI